MRDFRLSKIVFKIRFLGTAILGAYAVVNTLNLLLFRLIEGLGHAAASAITIPPMVVTMIYVVIPLARRLSQNKL
jgi:antibiotic biosynthesis monooxygenase (ABM) superfamily enzyme